MPSSLKFLNPYLRSDIDIYYRREQKIRELYQKVKTNPITLFYGLSGTGKTSMILCGLANEFDDIDWSCFVIRRGSNNRILDVVKKEVSYGKAIQKDVFSIIEDNYYNNFRPIYLIFDQLEELFIYGDKDEKNEFINFLVRVKSEFNFAKVILVIREEFFVHLGDFESHIPEIFQNRVQLEPVNKQEAEEIIRKIGQLYNLTFDDQAIRQIIDQITLKPKGYQQSHHYEIHDERIELSYLQVYFKEIIDANRAEIENLKAPQTMKITLEKLPERGALKDVLVNYLDKCIVEISRHGPENPKEEDIWRILYLLVSHKGTKQRLNIAEIENTFNENRHH